MHRSLLALLSLLLSFPLPTSAQPDRAPSSGDELTLANLEATLDAHAARGLSGVVYVKTDGVERVRRAYGMANPEMGIPNAIDTIFGIGSRPIDFTVAAVLLLAQRDELSLDDTIDTHLEGVPDDKRSITLRHLVNGESGLRDFHGLPGDWDQDLAWIDRAEAERRILAEPLLFAPGERREHSHSAYGLLASVIERVSRVAYLQFLRENFFDPAGMTRTFEYGDAHGLGLDAFAVGGGPSSIGLPNISPNWGPTSWLVKGSGGMVSTLDDLLRFYEFVRTSGVLEPRYAAIFLGPSVNFDGSDRGFELFSASDNAGADTAYLFVNMAVPNPQFEELAAALERLVLDGMQQ